jgi:putative ABC transport system permease protein
MLWTLAWRNVWRNKKRSGVIILAVISGLWAGLLTTGIMNGMSVQMVHSAIDDRLAHIQLHKLGFRQRERIRDVIPGGPAVFAGIDSIPGVAHSAERSVITAMASSPTTTKGVVIYGITPSDEKHVSDISRRMVAGTYFESDKRNPIIIGRELADRLDITLGHKIVLTAQDYNGDIGAGAFRVVGIFKTVSSEFDKTTIFAEAGDIDRIFSLGGNIHEIAVLADDNVPVDSLAAAMRRKYPDLDVATWKQLAPELSLMTDTTIQMLMIFLAIVLIALAFSLTNTMLMAVMERVREFGVVMALGMKHGSIIRLLMLETIFIASIGTVIGIGIGAATLSLLQRHGIDLSIVATGLANSGIDKIIYPTVPGTTYIWLFVLVLVTSVASALYPAIKAIRLNPVTAIRTY